jgi:hypothetical protein
MSLLLSVAALIFGVYCCDTRLPCTLPHGHPTCATLPRFLFSFFFLSHVCPYPSVPKPSETSFSFCLDRDDSVAMLAHYAALDSKVSAVDPLAGLTKRRNSKVQSGGDAEEQFGSRPSSNDSVKEFGEVDTKITVCAGKGQVSLTHYALLHCTHSSCFPPSLSLSHTHTYMHAYIYTCIYCLRHLILAFPTLYGGQKSCLRP